jgi:hypothetical protein
VNELSLDGNIRISGGVHGIGRQVVLLAPACSTIRTDTAENVMKVQGGFVLPDQPDQAGLQSRTPVCKCSRRYAQGSVVSAKPIVNVGCCVSTAGYCTQDDPPSELRANHSRKAVELS